MIFSNLPVASDFLEGERSSVLGIWITCLEVTSILGVVGCNDSDDESVEFWVEVCDDWEDGSEIIGSSSSGISVTPLLLFNSL